MAGLRNEYRGLLFFLEIPGAGLEVFAPAAGGGVGCFGLLIFQIVPVGLAVAAADDIEMKFDVRRVLLGQDTQKATAQLGERGTAKPVAAPDFPQGMAASIATSVDGGQSPQERRIGAARPFRGAPSRRPARPRPSMIPNRLR